MKSASPYVILSYVYFNFNKELVNWIEIIGMIFFTVRLRGYIGESIRASLFPNIEY